MSVKMSSATKGPIRLSETAFEPYLLSGALNGERHRLSGTTGPADSVAEACSTADSPEDGMDEQR
jgi:hypothetical protein